MSKSVGQKLRQAREARSLSLEEVSQATYMRASYLQALETGELDGLPSITQARGFLRAYADFLGLDGNVLLSELADDVAPHEPVATTPTSPILETKDISKEQVDAIFREIGADLRQQRELLGLSLEDIARHTHLRLHYLEAIEAGHLDELPSPVQGRGMLKNFATFIGLDPEPLLLHFAEALQARLANRQSNRLRSSSQIARPTLRVPSPWRKIFSRETILTALVSIFLFSFMIWGILRILETRSQAPVAATAPSIADVLLATATATETPTPQTPTSTLAAAPILESQPPPLAMPVGTLATVQVGTVQVYVTVLQRAWMRVTVDGKPEFDGRIIPGSAYQFSGKQQVEILTGNGAALEVFFQQQDMGPMGNFGQVVDNVYTLEGILLPTATITATPSETPKPSPTSRQTGTPTTPKAP
jgi:cytoskeleton protein RodZ